MPGQVFRSSVARPPLSSRAPTCSSTNNNNDGQLDFHATHITNDQPPTATTTTTTFTNPPRAWCSALPAARHCRRHSRATRRHRPNAKTADRRGLSSPHLQRQQPAPRSQPAAPEGSATRVPALQPMCSVRPNISFGPATRRPTGADTAAISCSLVFCVVIQRVFVVGLA